MVRERNLYDKAYSQLTGAGVCIASAAISVTEDYLDNRPRLRGKVKVTGVERDAAFWSSAFLESLPADSWRSEQLTLALARYMGQERVSSVPLLDRVATLAPESLLKAVRRSGLVLKPDSPRRAEVDRLAAIHPEVLGESAQILSLFGVAFQQRVALVEQCKVALSDLSPLELLVYASFYAFERLVPQDPSSAAEQLFVHENAAKAWSAINNILLWKLGSATDEALSLTERDIAQSLAKHMSPFLFPSQAGSSPRRDLRRAFDELVEVQIELNEFISRSADAFSYDDSIRFVVQGDRLEIVVCDAAARAAWARNGRKFARLHDYWLFRAMEEFVDSGMATRPIGRPENHEANRLAWIKALRTQLRLSEVYGLDENVMLQAGVSVDLFRAVLSLELMSAFFEGDFLVPYARGLQATGNWLEALSRLAMSGLMQPGSENRFPLTWSERESKVARITGWTVTADLPHGSSKMAGAILDFWTSDWRALAAQLRQEKSALQPELFERPILKMGRFLFQLPWVVALQNNMTAAINNLRRVGARRDGARDEARRIEQRLAELFERRGFRVVRGLHLPASSGQPGEVDLICAHQGVILVLEVKSTFLRATQKEAWLHTVTTLRKAGLQLKRNVAAVGKALAEDVALRTALAIDGELDGRKIHGWIVDTSIESDHKRFSGFLKVSIEEVIIALRDDRHLLRGFAETLEVPGGDADGKRTLSEALTLYPSGFSADRFVEVVEGEAVWETSRIED